MIVILVHGLMALGHDAAENQYKQLKGYAGLFLASCSVRKSGRDANWCCSKLFKQHFDSYHQFPPCRELCKKIFEKNEMMAFESLTSSRIDSVTLSVCDRANV